MWTQLLSLPGDAVRNEDFALAVPDLAIVLDGVTCPPDLGTGCEHGTPWFVRRLAANVIVRAFQTGARAPLTDVLAAAIDATRSDHHGRCDLRHPGTPSATVALLRRAEGQVEHLVLADATVVIDRTDRPIEAISDLRIDAIEPDLQAEVKASPYGSPQRAALTEKWMCVQREHRNIDGGFWIAGALPSAAWKAVTGSVPLTSLTRMAALSDGASRYVDLLGIGSWSDALDAMNRDLSGFLRAVRDHEQQDPACLRWPRWKRHDDATAVLWHPDPTAHTSRAQAA